MNYTQSDGQTLALCNRDYWEIMYDGDAGTEVLDTNHSFGQNEEEKRQIKENVKIYENLAEFCIRNWDNDFMRDIKVELNETLERL